MDQEKPNGLPASNDGAANKPKAPATKETIALVLDCYARGYSSQQAADSAGVDLATVDSILGDAIAAQGKSD